MRLLLTPILYLGLLCPASVLATPIHATPSSTEVDSTGNVTRTLHARDEKPVTEYTVELKLHHLRPKGTKPHVITEEVADNLRNGMEILLPWILPIFVADEENRRLDPKTVPDLHSSFRVSELSYEGSYTTGRESIVPRDQAKHFHMPRDGWSVGIDEYWLYLMILGSNGMPRARLVICLVYPERYQQGKLGVEDFLFGTTALEGRVGYGHNLVKNQITLIRPNGLLTTCDGEMIDFSVEKSRWQPSGLAPRKTMELGGETTFSFQEGFVRSVKGGEGSGEGSEGGGGGGAEDVAKGDKPSNWKTRMRQRLPFVSKS